MMDAATLAALKAHCHIDFDDDDNKLRSLHSAAVAYMSGAGVPAPEQQNEVYQLCVFSLVNEWYDGASIGSCTVGLRELINQLKLMQVGNTGIGL